MLHENLKRIRKSKGLSQGELAIKINVVRQTISKWEQGLSVPDSEMLLKISEALDTPVSVLLGGAVTEESEENDLQIMASKLELLNEQYANNCEHRRKYRRFIFIIIALISAGTLLSNAVALIYELYANASFNTMDAGIIGGKDNATSIFVSSLSIQSMISLIAVVVLILSCIGIHKAKRD